MGFAPIVRIPCKKEASQHIPTFSLYKRHAPLLTSIFDIVLLKTMKNQDLGIWGLLPCFNLKHHEESTGMNP